MTIQADITKLKDSGSDFTLCSLGIMGTEYVRNVSLPKYIEVLLNESITLDVENIIAQPAIGNELDIHLRIASEDNPIASISVFQGSPSQLLINAHFIGSFRLVLESYDNNS